MRKNGVLLECDRCGKSILLGKNKNGDFEEAPVNWGHYSGKDLCPECAKEYVDIMREFFKNA